MAERLDLLSDLRAINARFEAVTSARTDMAEERHALAASVGKLKDATASLLEAAHRAAGHPPPYDMIEAAKNAPRGEARTAAETAARMASEDLGMSPVKIMWLKEEAMPTAHGKASEARPGVIYLREDLPAERAAEIAAHEVRHLHQYRRGWYRNHTNPEIKSAGEWDAERYGKTMAEKVQRALAHESLLRELKAINDLAKPRAPCGCSKAHADDGWLAKAVNERRAAYERQVCTDPKTRTTAPFCRA